MLPYATLEPVRELLLQMFMGEKFGRDSIWETHLANELWNTDVELEAVLDEVVMSLNDVLELKPGSRLMLNTQPNSTIDMRCGNVPLFRGKMGRKSGNIAVRIGQKLRKM
jgi:flagellar motor switch protein FliM